MIADLGKSDESKSDTKKMETLKSFIELLLRRIVKINSLIKYFLEIIRVFID